jgi:N-methylhydantoinase B/oxoprolinase/acetone carboxylase alpha subunit
LSAVEVGLLTDRRKTRPYGLEGGKAGSPGGNSLRSKGKTQVLPAKCSFEAKPGDILRIETPGGGGWGRRSSKSEMEQNQGAAHGDLRRPKKGTGKRPAP